MKNQIYGAIFNHIYTQNRRTILSRCNILLKQLSSASPDQNFIYRRQLEHPKHSHALRGVFPFPTNFHIPLRSISRPGVLFLQHRSIQATVDDQKLKLSSSLDETSDQEEKILTVEQPSTAVANEADFQVNFEGEPKRIKPSHDRGNKESIYYFLNDFDQIAVGTVKIINLYKSYSKGHEGVVQVLSNSLSKVLNHYYPLAGKLGINPEGKFIVECIDKGVVFIDATANCMMSDVLLRLDESDTLLKFVFDVPGVDQILDIPLMTVQVTRFQCGGFALGIAFNHCMFDGISGGEFLKNWGRIAHGLPLDTIPFLDRTILNPQEPTKPTPHHGILQLNTILKTKSPYDDQPVELKSFVFDKEKILRLKTIAMKEESSISKCSAFDVLTAFMWRAKTKAFNVPPNEQIKLLFGVNARSKLKHPLPKGFFGNAAVPTNSLCLAGDLLEKDFNYAVKLVQEAKNMVNEEYVRSFSEHFDMGVVYQSFTTTTVVTTFCHLGFNEMDFGWGEAIYVAPVLPSRQVAMFAPQGKNVVLKISLPRLVMNAFQELVMQI